MCELREQAARRHGLQIVWTIWHYGIPEDLEYFSPELPARFERFCTAFAQCIARLGSAEFPQVFVPINEISFLAWAVCGTGLMSTRVPRECHDANELKQRLVEAALRGTRAIREVIPDARFMHVDPLIHVISDGDGHVRASARTEGQFEALDMMCGRRDPQLGGSADCIDVIGLNYYHSNQWEVDTNERLHWHLADTRRKPLPELLADVAARYGKPLAIAETSHFGDGRARWIEEIARDLNTCAARGLHLHGACLYPIIDRPDWEEPQRWHHSGLWDVDPHADMRRRLDPAYAHHLKRAQALLDPTQRVATHQENFMTLVVFSHLRWDFVFQRPQHLMTRLAEHARIMLVEEPVIGDHDGVECLHPFPNIDILRLHTKSRIGGFDDTHADALRAMVRNHLREENIDDNIVAWFYTPMALPLLKGLPANAVVYDCMDELSAFSTRRRSCSRAKRAARDGQRRVHRRAEPVRSATRRNAQTHCFPSSVDVAHFSAARDRRIADERFRFADRCSGSSA